MESYGRMTRLGQNEILTRDLGARDGGIGRGRGQGGAKYTAGWDCSNWADPSTCFKSSSNFQQDFQIASNAPGFKNAKPVLTFARNFPNMAC
jgi:hypothetical protein